MTGVCACVCGGGQLTCALQAAVTQRPEHREGGSGMAAWLARAPEEMGTTRRARVAPRVRPAAHLRCSSSCAYRK